MTPKQDRIASPKEIFDGNITHTIDTSQLTGRLVINRNYQWLLMPQRIGPSFHKLMIGKVCLGTVRMDTAKAGWYKWHCALPGIKETCNHGSEQYQSDAMAAVIKACNDWFAIVDAPVTK